MIIDFHTHIYPEWVAAKILPAAKRKLKVEVPGTGAPEDLRRMMRASGIAESVLLPLAKGREDVSSLNDWILSVSGDGLIPLGLFILSWRTWRQSWTGWLPEAFGESR